MLNTYAFLIALIAARQAANALPAPDASSPTCVTAWSCLSGHSSGYCDNASPVPNFLPCPGGEVCDSSVSYMCVAELASSDSTGAISSTTTTLVALPTAGGAQAALIYPPTTCPYVSSAYTGGVTTGYTTTVPTWASSSYVPVATPSLAAAPSVVEVSLPDGYSCNKLPGDLYTGGQSASCVEGGQMASTYTAEPGANCVEIDFDVEHSFVAAYAAPAGATTPFCGQHLEITAKATGNKITVTIVDACPTCWGVQQIVSGTYATRNGATIDLSAAAFNALFGLDPSCGGVYDVEYDPLPGSFTPQASYGESA